MEFFFEHGVFPTSSVGPVWSHSEVAFHYCFKILKKPPNHLHLNPCFFLAQKLSLVWKQRSKFLMVLVCRILNKDCCSLPSYMIMGCVGQRCHWYSGISSIFMLLYFVFMPLYSYSREWCWKQEVVEIHWMRPQVANKIKVMDLKTNFI